MAGVFQYETGAVFTTLGSGQRDPFGAYGRTRTGTRIPVKVFDPRENGCSGTRMRGPTAMIRMVITAEAAAATEAAPGHRRAACRSSRLNPAPTASPGSDEGPRLAHGTTTPFAGFGEGTNLDELDAVVRRCRSSFASASDAPPPGWSSFQGQRRVALSGPMKCPWSSGSGDGPAIKFELEVGDQVSRSLNGSSNRVAVVVVGS